MSTLKLIQIIEQTADQFEKADLFYGHGTDNAWDEAVSLVLASLQLPFNISDKNLDRNLSVEEVNRIQALAQCRIKEKKPLPYLINKAYFFGLEFYVDERVIIPRSPIAELLENQLSPWINHNQVHAILDLCTGSGCIAIASAFVFENAKIDAVDINNEALAVAAINCQRHDVTDQVTLIQSDIFSNLVDKQYDIIISNPPYVSSYEMSTLPVEYSYEPTLALIAKDEGLAIAINILKNAAKFLNDQGILIMEVGNSWQALQARYPQVPFLWLEFTKGGEGIFLLTKEQLLNYQF